MSPPKPMESCNIHTRSSPGGARIWFPKIVRASVACLEDVDCTQGSDVPRCFSSYSFKQISFS